MSATEPEPEHPLIQALRRAISDDERLAGGTGFRTERAIDALDAELVRLQDAYANAFHRAQVRRS